jgi:nitrate/nitrite transporter NarK
MEGAKDSNISVHSINDELLEKKVTIRQTKFRWWALALACSTNVGSYYCFDNPQALQKYLEADLHIDTATFAWLYTVYSLPNIILPLLGGLVIDRISIRVALALYAFFLIIGQSIFAYGTSQKDFTIMIIGRIVFGFGGESLSVANSAVTAKWFVGKELAFAMGLTLCVARLGSSLNSVFSPKIYVWTGDTLYAPMLVGVVICILSWIAGLVLGVIDSKADKEEGTQAATGDDMVSFKDFALFEKMFYLLLFNCFFLYGAFFGIMDNINNILNVRFGFQPTVAGNYITIVYLCSAVITPLFGKFIDKFGRRVSFMLVASFVFAATHICIGFMHDGTDKDPQYWIIAGLLGIGLFYSVYASIFWPCVPLVTEARVVGSAYGMITALQNLMLATIPLAMGYIHDATKAKDDGYFWTEIVLAGLVCMGIGITTWMYFLDKTTGNRLEMPGSKRQEKKDN